MMQEDTNVIYGFTFGSFQTPLLVKGSLLGSRLYRTGIGRLLSFEPRGH